MSQAECTAEVEAWLVRNNFTAPQRAHLLQQVDALSDFSEAVDEDIPAITEGWSSLARSKLRRCVAALCRARGWDCKLAVAAPAPAPAPAPTAEITPAPSPPPQRPSPRPRPPKKQRKADTSGDAALARQLAAAESPRASKKKKRPAAKPAPRPKKKAKPPASSEDDATAGDAELARRLSLGLPVRTASGATMSTAGWDTVVAPKRAARPATRGSGSKRREDMINRRVRGMLWHKPGARIAFIRPNPKRPAVSSSGAKSAARYDTYMRATTVAAFHASKGTLRDLVYDICRGWCTVDDDEWARLAAEDAAPPKYVYDAASNVTLAPGAPPTALMQSGGRREYAPRPDARGALAAERWAARYDEVCWAREGDVWWPGVVMDPAAIAGAAAARARREQGQRYAVYNFGVDSAEQFSL